MTGHGLNLLTAHIAYFVPLLKLAEFVKAEVDVKLLFHTDRSIWH